MKYKEILSIKYPDRFVGTVDDTYAGIIWNAFDLAPKPTQAELDADIANYLANETIQASIGASVTSALVQLISGYTGRVTGTSIIPADTSVPLITEGTELWGEYITPVSLESKIEIVESLWVDSNSNGRYITFTLFRNNTCINATPGYITTSGKPASAKINYVDTPNTLSPIRYSLRVGVSSSATWVVNANSNNSVNFGSVGRSCHTIKEYL